MSMPPIAVLAGGLGTRLRPITETIPKSLVEVAGRPFITHQLELFARRGIRKAVYCIGYLGEQIEDFIGDGVQFGVEVAYARDGDILRGTGGAIRQAMPLLGDEFLVTYGDSYLDIAYEAVVAAFRTAEMPALMTVFRNEGCWDTSNAEFVGGRVVAYDKVNRTERMHYIDYGLLAMTPDAFIGWEHVESFDLASVLGPMARGGRLAGFETTVRFYETGSASGIADLASHFADMSRQSAE